MLLAQNRCRGQVGMDALQGDLSPSQENIRLRTWSNVTNQNFVDVNYVVPGLTRAAIPLLRQVKAVKCCIELSHRLLTSKARASGPRTPASLSFGTNVRLYPSKFQTCWRSCAVSI